MTIAIRPRHQEHSRHHFFRSVRKTVKSDCKFLHACLPTRMSAWSNSAPIGPDLYEIWCLSLSSDMCRENSSFIKILAEVTVLYINTYAHL